mgnify:CR=1 FL=1
MLIPRREHVTRHMLTTNQQCYTALEDVKLPELQIAELNGKIIEWCDDGNDSAPDESLQISATTEWCESPEACQCGTGTRVLGRKLCRHGQGMALPPRNERTQGDERQALAPRAIQVQQG